VVACQTLRISSTSKTCDKSDDPGLALIAGTLLSWARINNAEFMSYPDDTCNREEILIACNDGKRSAISLCLTRPQHVEIKILQTKKFFILDKVSCYSYG
jgi:hypothetical protein